MLCFATENHTILTAFCNNPARRKIVFCLKSEAVQYPAAVCSVIFKHGNKADEQQHAEQVEKDVRVGDLVFDLRLRARKLDDERNEEREKRESQNNGRQIEN